MVLFLQMDPPNSHGFLSGRFDIRGPPSFKLETKQEKPQEEKIPVTSHGGFKNFQKTPHSTSSTL